MRREDNIIGSFSAIFCLVLIHFPLARYLIQTPLIIKHCCEISDMTFVIYRSDQMCILNKHDMTFFI